MAKKKIKPADILDAYMKHVLEHGSVPDSMYSFASSLEMKEAALYEHFASFMAMDQAVFVQFFEHSLDLLERDEQFATYDAKNKLLSFYYTFFEVMTANRSFVVATLRGRRNYMEAMRTLSLLRIKFKKFVDRLDIDTLDLKKTGLNKFKQESLTEIAWNQMLTTFKFWLDDTSPAFEKTDIFIEKSLNASFDLINITPLESLFDFGKFLFKERVVA